MMFFTEFPHVILTINKNKPIISLIKLHYLGFNEQGLDEGGRMLRR